MGFENQKVYFPVQFKTKDSKVFKSCTWSLNLKFTGHKRKAGRCCSWCPDRRSRAETSEQSASPWGVSRAPRPRLPPQCSADCPLVSPPISSGPIRVPGPCTGVHPPRRRRANRCQATTKKNAAHFFTDNTACCPHWHKKLFEENFYFVLRTKIKKNFPKSFYFGERSYSC